MAMKDKAKAIEAKESGQVCKKTTIKDIMHRWEELSDLIEATYKGFDTNDNAMANGGMVAIPDPDTGEIVKVKTVQFACSRRLPTPASVTAYYNGTVVWTGIKPLELPAPVMEPEVPVVAEVVETGHEVTE